MSRPAVVELPDLDGYFDRWSGLHGGYDPRRGFWPRAWLTFAYHCALPLARRRVAPDALTVAGMAVSAAVALVAGVGGRWPLLGVAIVVAAGLLDNLDGAVAALTRRATSFGYVFDSVADRVSDGCYLVALWLLGAPGWLCVLGGLVTMFHEFVRSEATGAGMVDVVVVTVAERPTRVIVAAFTLLSAGAVPAYAHVCATTGAAVWLAAGAVGFVQLVSAVQRFLRAGR